MFHKLRERAQDEKGFTLIELLVVILIIGILAAIALPAFLNQRGKAQDSEAKSAARTAQTAMETFYTDNQNYNADKAALIAHRAGDQRVPGPSDRHGQRRRRLHRRGDVEGQRHPVLRRGPRGRRQRDAYLPRDRQGLQERQHLVVSGT